MHSDPDTDDTPQPRPRRARKRTAAERVRAKQFPAAMRGYDREAVDAWREEIAEWIARLEEQEPRDTAVRHAIDEVGRETSAILQRAHQSASDIEARSRSQADARLEEADREAELTVREAEERADRLEADTRAVWEQRLRLIDEMRQLADEVLGVADDALERVDPPGGRRAEPEENAFDESDLLDTVEDEATLETGNDLETENDTEDFDMRDDETRVFRAPGDTEAPDPVAASALTDATDAPPGDDLPADEAEGSPSPERL